MKIFAERGRPIENGEYRVKAEFSKEDYTNTLTRNPQLNMLLEYGGKYMKTVSVNDFFCGAGGMGLGFKNAGFRLAGAWDFDKYAVDSYGHNVSPKVKQADITQMSGSDVPYSDVWTFGFPCQDLSIAGKQAGLFEGKRSGLFFEVMRLLDETVENDPDNLPKIIMAENVKGLKPYLEVLESEYKQRGYKMYYTLYNSKYWGVPQNRERYFVVGVHESIEKEFVFPIQQTEYVPRLSTILEPVVDEKYYISPEKAESILEQVENKLRIKEATKKGYAEATVGDTLNISHPNSETRRGRWGNQIAQTLLTGQEQVVVENGFRVRKLTVREYARLQGFPESFEIIVSNSQAYKQFGNAVSVPVAQAIAERIRMFLLSL